MALTQIDVLVLGAGPAGTTAARALARLGRSVVIVDAAPVAGVGSAIGETFPPAIADLLGELSLTREFEACPKVDSLGVALAGWGTPEPRMQDYMCQPGGRGSHVDRRAFNALLARAACDAGATLRTGVGPVRPRRVQPSGRTTWRVAPELSGGEIEARFLIDASGRRSGAGRMVIDRLVALVRHWATDDPESGFANLTCSGPAPPSPSPHRLTGEGEADWRNEGEGVCGTALIEACRDGWCYVAPQPGGGLVTAFQADPAWFRERRGRWSEVWAELLARHLPETARRMMHARPASNWRVAPAGSSMRLHAAGADWAAAGDAALACDPLSGAGVLRALRDGLAVAGAVHRALEDDRVGLVEYDHRHHRACRRYVTERAQHYASETRWRDRPFWQARAGRPPSQTPHPNPVATSWGEGGPGGEDVYAFRLR